MSTIELRTSVLAEIASIMDHEDLLKEALIALRKITKAKSAAPCRFTVEELKKKLSCQKRMIGITVIVPLHNYEKNILYVRKTKVA